VDVTADRSAQVATHEDHASIEARLSELERDHQETRDHRTQVRTLLSLAGAAAIAVILGAGVDAVMLLAAAFWLCALELSRTPRSPSLSFSSWGSHA